MTFLKRAKRAIVGTILATSFLYPISTATTEPTQQVQLSEEQKAFLWILHLMQEEAQKTPEQKQREAEITEEVYKDLRQAWHIIQYGNLIEQSWKPHDDRELGREDEKCYDKIRQYDQGVRGIERKIEKTLKKKKKPREEIELREYERAEIATGWYNLKKSLRTLEEECVHWPMDDLQEEVEDLRDHIKSLSSRGYTEMYISLLLGEINFNPGAVREAFREATSLYKYRIDNEQSLEGMFGLFRVIVEADKTKLKDICFWLLRYDDTKTAEISYRLIDSQLTYQNHDAERLGVQIAERRQDWGKANKYALNGGQKHLAGYYESMIPQEPLPQIEIQEARERAIQLIPTWDNSWVGPPAPTCSAPENEWTGYTGELTAPKPEYSLTDRAEKLYEGAQLNGHPMSF